MERATFRNELGLAHDLLRRQTVRGDELRSVRDARRRMAVERTATDQRPQYRERRVMAVDQ